MMETKEQRFARLLKKYSQYDREAYNLVYEALEFTLEELKRAPLSHVTGKELVYGLRKYAIDEYGWLAQTVLNELGIGTTNDIGRIVFNLIEFDLMGKQELDKREDFKDVYRFNKVFNLRPIFWYFSDYDFWDAEYVKIRSKTP